MTHAKKSPRRRLSDSILWGILSAFCAISWFFVISDLASYLHDDWLGLGLISYLTLICVAGNVRNWGPLVPCTILGMVVAALGTDPISSSAVEAVFKSLGVPLIGAILGFFCGLFWERVRWDNERLSEPQAKKVDQNSADEAQATLLPPGNQR
jgi:hypothetical protein